MSLSYWKLRVIATYGGWDWAQARVAGRVDPDLQAWGWLRLGCYGRAAAVGAGSTRLRGALARAAALAACGREEEAGTLAKERFPARRLSTRARRWVAQTLGPFAPALALDYLSKETATPLRAALLHATGRFSEAREDAAALQRRGAPADIHLVAANCGLVDPLSALNRRFAADGLAAVDADGVPGPRTLRPAAGASERDGRRRSLPRAGPLVSVIMPAYESGERLEPAVRSLLNQSYETIEIIVVDDASRDDTAAIAARLARLDARVRPLRMAENGGPYVARMAALAIARGEFVTCHDSDDWAHPERIARQVAPLLKHQGLVATASSWLRMTDSGLFFARQTWPLVRLNPASPMFRRDKVLDRIGGFDLVRAGADSEFFARLKLAFGRRAILRLPDLLTVGAHRPGSLMTDPEIGAAGGAPSPSRLAYWEAWRSWHIDELAAGRIPRLTSDSLRPFPAPAELQAPQQPASRLTRGLSRNSRDSLAHRGG